MQVKRLANEKHKSISILQSSGETLKQKISDLSARREVLLAELKKVEEALSQAQQEESQLPDMIKTLQQERNTQARKALQMKKKLKPVEGSADDDIREIEEADQIRLHAISAIHALLNAWAAHRRLILFRPYNTSDYSSLADRTVIGIFENIMQNPRYISSSR